jgi:hypothetical protein
MQLQLRKCLDRNSMYCSKYWRAEFYFREGPRRYRCLLPDPKHHPCSPMLRRQCLPRRRRLVLRLLRRPRPLKHPHRAQLMLRPPRRLSHPHLPRHRRRLPLLRVFYRPMCPVLAHCLLRSSELVVSARRKPTAPLAFVAMARATLTLLVSL